MNAQLPTRTETGYCLGNLLAEGLPPRQSQILLMRASGASIKSIAQTLQCSAANVQQGINNLFYKLNAHSSHELITKAFLRNYLKTFAVMLFLTSIFGTNPPDQNTPLRTGRIRTTQQMRTQRGGNNKKLWS